MTRGTIRIAAAILGFAALAAAGEPPAPRRVVCLGPSLVETAFALGCGDRIVAVDDYAAWPSGVHALPRVGGLMDPNLERIVALAPDLLLLASPMDRLQAMARRQGIPVAVVPMDDLAGIRRGIREVARRLGCPDRGEAILRRIDAGLAALHARTPADGPSVVVQIGRPPGPGLRGVVVAGGRTFLGELVTLAGGRNVFASARRRYFAPSLERLAAAPPDIVLVLDAGAPDPSAEARAMRAAWRRLLGGTAPPVTVLTDPIFVVPGPRVIEAARRLAVILRDGESGP